MVEGGRIARTSNFATSIPRADLTRDDVLRRQLLEVEVPFAPATPTVSADAKVELACDSERLGLAFETPETVRIVPPLKKTSGKLE